MKLFESKSQWRHLHDHYPVFRRVELLITVLAAAVVILIFCLTAKSCGQKAAQTAVTATDLEVTEITPEIVPETEPETTKAETAAEVTITTPIEPAVVETTAASEPEIAEEVTGVQVSAWERAYAEAAAQVNMADAKRLALAIQGEAALARTTAEQAAIAWVILNQVDDRKTCWMVTSIEYALDVWTTNVQGYTYLKNRGVTPDEEYVALAIDVLARYAMERAGWEWVGRVIPANYLSWFGDGCRINYFSPDHKGSLAVAKATAWDWSLPDPYND